jgi:TolA-binding protein
MKRSERRHLKENPFAVWVAEVSQIFVDYRREITYGAIAVLAVVVVAAGYLYWRSQVSARADVALASALTVADAPVVPPPPAGTTSAPAPQPGSYPSEAAKLQAAAPLFVAVADRFPGTRAAIAAQYRAASAFAELGRFDEASARYREVIAQDPKSLYAEMSELGLAGVELAQGRADEAVTIYLRLVSAPDTRLPVDGLLVQLGRAYLKAGKTAEAAQTYKRIVDEFPQSPYVADARQALDGIGEGRQS